MRWRGTVRKLLTALAAAWALPVAAAGAQERALELVTTGPAGTNTLAEPQHWSWRADGQAALFTTTERLLAGDTDDRLDVYLRQEGRTILMSSGERAGNQPFDAVDPVLSASGTHAFFETAEPLSFADGDQATDVYRRVGDTTALVSDGPAADTGDGVDLLHVTPGGEAVLIATAQPLLAADTDAVVDLYEVRNGTRTLRTPGTAGDLRFAGATPDLSRVFFQTTEPVLPQQDTDGGADDVYEHSGGRVRLVSAASGHPESASGALAVQRIAQDGGRVVLGTGERLIGADADARIDFYRLEGGASLLSTGAAGGNADVDAAWYAGSADARVVAFTTPEALLATDKDANVDVYVNRNGSLELASVGPAGGQGAVDVSAEGGNRVSADGAGVAFVTAERLVGADTDDVADVYERRDGATRLVSQGELPTPTAVSGGTGSYAPEGGDVWFQTADPVTREDVDAQSDVYVRQGGSVTRLATPGRDAYEAAVAGFSADGSHLFFSTRERLVGEDADEARDLYAMHFVPAPAPPPPADPVDVVAPTVEVALGRRVVRLKGKKRGTTVTVTSSEAGQVRLTFARLLAGKRYKGRCVAFEHRPSRRQRCKRARTVKGAVTRPVVAGATKVRFRGRVGGRLLEPGRYRLTARATDAAGNASRRARVTFRVRKR